MKATKQTRDELLAELHEMAIKAQTAILRAEQAERERDAWKRDFLKKNGERDEAIRERDEWKGRAESFARERDEAMAGVLDWQCRAERAEREREEASAQLAAVRENLAAARRGSDASCEWLQSSRQCFEQVERERDEARAALTEERTISAQAIEQAERWEARAACSRAWAREQAARWEALAASKPAASVGPLPAGRTIAHRVRDLSLEVRWSVGSLAVRAGGYEALLSPASHAELRRILEEAAAQAWAASPAGPEAVAAAGGEGRDER